MAKIEGWKSGFQLHVDSVTGDFVRFNKIDFVVVRKYNLFFIRIRENSVRRRSPEGNRFRLKDRITGKEITVNVYKNGDVKVVD